MRATRSRVRGFTLIELLVAVSLMAVLAVMSWRGLDGMVRARALTEARADAVLTLQVGLAQWAADLDAMVKTPQLKELDWDGRVLRMTRRSTTNVTDGTLVVAWTRRLVDGKGQWLRWQSPPVTQRGELLEAWQKAALWAQNPGDDERRREVAVIPLDEWQVFYFRGDAWTNPLSSDATQGDAQGGAPATPGVNVATDPGTTPDGVRLVLTLPLGQALSGKLTRDWVRPTVSGGKS